MCCLVATLFALGPAGRHPGLVAHRARALERHVRHVRVATARVHRGALDDPGVRRRLPGGDQRVRLRVAGHRHRRRRVLLVRRRLHQPRAGCRVTAPEDRHLGGVRTSDTIDVPAPERGSGVSDATDDPARVSRPGRGTHATGSTSSQPGSTPKSYSGRSRRTNWRSSVRSRISRLGAGLRPQREPRG